MAKPEESAVEVGTLAAVLLKQNEIIAAQTEMIGELRKSAPPRDVQYGDADYQAALKAAQRTFKTKTYQNGAEITDCVGPEISDETIDRVSKLKKGIYLRGIVEIDVTHDGRVMFHYRNKTPDQRMARSQDFANFTDLVNKIWAEMTAAGTAAA